MATTREQVRQLKLQGYSPKEIALQLGVHVGTVREHLRQSVQRSETARRIELIYEMTMEIRTLVHSLVKMDEREIRRRMKWLENHAHPKLQPSPLPDSQPFDG